jgi:hypothetical protein
VDLGAADRRAAGLDRPVQVLDRVPELRRPDLPKPAASSAPAWHIAAVSEKLPAAITPTDRSRAAASISSKSAAVRPELPTTTATPAAIAASVFALTAVADVYSISTSTPSSASATLP